MARKSEMHVARRRTARRRPSGIFALAVLALAWPFGANATVTIQEGLVSWYGGHFHAKPTASGELFDAEAMTMAHPTLPFGTQVKVINPRNGRSVVLTVNDRGPFVGSRIADLSQAAAAYLGILRRGIAHLRLEVLTASD
ncbi:MAG: septal ring lytic transglycosylase RlpA family protein [Steroidobacteraceae bacterium]|nr:septal ring lytic transglycosylase RlpA family protein [Steroidobacteraceae bacterium]